MHITIPRRFLLTPLYSYEGRAGLPSEFDSNYCYSLGLTAGNLIGKGLTSLMVSITGICGPVEQWNCGGVPLTMMMNMEKRHGYV
jgi:pyrophosphate--fructose-6-phosphate 1-phosphotransferase